MICSIYPTLASLLSTTLHVTNNDNATNYLKDTPIGHHYTESTRSAGDSVLNIALPAQIARKNFWWNETNENGEVVDRDGVYNELQITLDGYVFR